MNNQPTLKRYYFENAILCGNCNGTGLRDYMDYCRVCAGTGLETFDQFTQHFKGDLIAIHLFYNQCKNEHHVNDYYKQQYNENH